MNKIAEILQNAKAACSSVAYLQDEVRSRVLSSLATSLRANSDDILSGNRKDVSQFDEGDPMVDRLFLNEDRIQAICDSVSKIASFDSPVGRILDTRRVHSGLNIERVFVPLGLVGVVYESRPNVTVDVFALCFKSGNACILKGGKEARHTNLAILKIIREVLQTHGVNEKVISMVSCDRANVGTLIQSRLVDVCIPRGSKALVDFVRENAQVPVIETGAGVVHVYFDETGDLNKGTDIVLDSKCRRVSVCNALDCLVIHKNRLRDLPLLVRSLVKNNVEIFADGDAYKILAPHYKNLAKASEEDFGREFLDYKMAIRTVDSLQHAIDHISKYTSGHTECIVTEDKAAAEHFLERVDAGVVYWNAATSFSDGGEFGMGGEIGISTQKLHVRGPFALEGLVTYKWVVRGQGQIRG